MALGLRVLDNENFQIREKFMEFAVVEDLRCEILGYDGAVNMNGHLSGAQTFMSNKYPLATYVHCVAHSLKSVLTDLSNIPDIKHSMTVFREIVNFFYFGAKRSAVLTAYTEVNLKGVCKTQSVERHNVIQVLK
ncbi:hypothetical protein QYM36_012051 [Artemia franciscana]|uniref:DUF4371 domain-containing protein n=1 Tax=Artemia franciscana TaxID=6661 RepID=A0AA88L2G3_ARTSF|nr:hypothetical protein QYM36_012051 [Artemia franciscana]